MKALLKSFVASTIAILSLTQTLPAQPPQQEQPSKIVAGLVNEFRSQRRLRPLQESKELTNVAEECAALMAEKEAAAVDDDMRRLFRTSRSEPQVLVYVLDRRQRHAALVEQWKQSRALLSRELTQMGIGVAVGKSGKTYYCVLLSQRR